MLQPAVSAILTIYMIVAIDTSALDGADSVRGVGSYTRSLIDALQKYGKQHSFYFFTRGKKIPDDADVVHYPYFTPFFLTLPVLPRTPYIVTVHDLIPVAFPDKFPRGIRGTMKWYIQRYLLSRAARIITDSNASKEDIHRLTGISERIIDIVRLAPADVFRPERDRQRILAVQRKYDLEDPFILYVGDVNWNKNIKGLIRAFSRLMKIRTLKPMHLCLVGSAITNPALQETREITDLIRSLRLQTYIRTPGFVNNEDLRVLYAAARVYVQPSFAEGFGLPILEAMACGCPVVCSSASALLEIDGPVVGVDPGKPEHIADGLQRVLTMSEEERQERIQHGLEWVKKYTWERVAHETLTVYDLARP